MQVEWKAQPGPIHGVGSENEQVTDLGCVWMLKESSLFPPESPPGMTGAWTCWHLWFSHLFPLFPLEKVQPQSERGPHRKRSQMNSGRERERGTLLTWVWFLNTALPKAICACFPPLWVTLFPLLWNQFELGLYNFQPKEFQLTHLLLRYVVKIKWDHFSKRFKTAPSICLVNTGFHYCCSCSHVALFHLWSVSPCDTWPLHLLLLLPQALFPALHLGFFSSCRPNIQVLSSSNSPWPPKLASSSLSGAFPRIFPSF